MLSRVCTSCVRSARQFTRPVVLPAARPAPRAFSAAVPLYKKAPKHVQPEFEEDFVEDDFSEFDDDLSSPSSAPASDAQTREARYAHALTAVQAALHRAKQHHGRSHLPSTNLVHNLVRTSSPAQLPEVLKLVAKWRAANLPALPSAVAALLVKRLVDLEADEGQAAVEVLVNRDLYGVDVPSDLAALYPVFAKISRPHSAAPPAEGEGEPAATPVEQEQSAYRFLSANPADLAFALRDLAVQYAPGTAGQNAVVGLATLAAALRSGERSSARVNELVQQLQGVGEEALVRQAQRDLPRRWRDIVRMRARVVAEAMREEAHPEVEWFAHLAESLHAVVKK